MKRLEEHLRSMTEQVKVRRKFLRTSIDHHPNENIKKLINEIEQYRMKIDRTDQLV